MGGLQNEMESGGLWRSGNALRAIATYLASGHRAFQQVNHTLSLLKTTRGQLCFLISVLMENTR